MSIWKKISTNFSVTEKTLDVEDIPTLKICLNSKRIQGSEEILKYGRDLTIQAMYSTGYPWEPESNSTMITLAEGQNEIAFANHGR